MKTVLTALYLGCFAGCSWPSIVRMIRRRSSADLSVWREWFLLAGVGAQFVVMRLDRVGWHVWISPLNTAVAVSVTLLTIYWYRKRTE